MKVPMSHIVIYGNKKDRKAVLEYLQRRKIMDISESDKTNEEFGFSSLNTSDSQSEFLRDSGIGERAINILSEYVPEKSDLLDSLNGREQLSAKEYYKYTDAIPKIMITAKRIIELSNSISENQGQIIKLKSEIEELQPWFSLDVAMNSKGTKNTAISIGSFSEELTEENIIERYNSEEAPSAHIEVINSAPQQTCAFVIYNKADAEGCEKRLRKIGFSKPKTAYNGIPRNEAAERRKKIESLEKEIEILKSEIISYKEKRSALKFMEDYYSMRAEKYNVLSKLSQRKKVFVVDGYVPSNEEEQLKAVLEHEYNAAVEIESASDDAPVMIKNSYLTEPVEGIVRTFAMPAKNEVDPTSIMAFFYYIFFGIMLSDAGYGLIMAIGCGIVLKKFKNMEDDMKKTIRMFLYCGLSTLFWGILFGGYFGDLIPVVSKTFFGKEVTIPPIWFEPVKDPMRMLMFSFLLGLIHLFTALGVKAYQSIKAKDYMSLFVDCICWYMLVGGGVVYLFHVDMFLSMAGMTTKLPTIWANIAAIIAGIGALGILIFTARSGGIGKRLAKGAYALYGATSWLSDILSYSRLLALGLATGVIATVFNKMGSMFGGGIIGAILFIIVFIIGNALNMGVNLLGAYVHTNRLQFVEFFGKFYEGGGREFSPFESKTKYFKFKEEKQS